MRSYIHQTIEVNPSMTEHELKETVAKVIDEKGKENIYKIILDGMRDPEISYNVDTLDPYGNVIEITDQTRPAWQSWNSILRIVWNIRCFVRECGH